VVNVATRPAARVAASGVPVLADTRPRAGGPIPSRLAAAWVREDAITQVRPLATRIHRKATAAASATGPAQDP
jgi:hypothetical protein